MKKKLFFVLFIAILLTNSLVVFAQTAGNTPRVSGGNALSDSASYAPLAPITDPYGNSSQNLSFAGYLQFIYRVGIGACFLLGVVMMVINGIEYIVTESIFQKKASTQRMWNALIGLAIALVSYLLLFTINPDLIELKDLKLFQPKTDTTTLGGTENGVRKGGMKGKTQSNVQVNTSTSQPITPGGQYYVE